MTCSVCGAEMQDAPLTWTMAAEGFGEGRRVVYYCETCSRENLRSIEAGLDRRYW